MDDGERKVMGRSLRWGLSIACRDDVTGSLVLVLETA